MKKIEKMFYMFLFLIILYIGFGFKVLPFILKEELVKNLNENLTQKTTIENIEFNPLTLEAKIYNFKIVDSNNLPIISFEKFSINFSLLKSIEKKHISFKNILLKDTYINIVEEKDGNLNLLKLLKENQKEETKIEEKPSYDIKFLVSKLILKNANINYIRNGENPYSLSLNNINYTLYDLGTYKNILSSNDLKFKLNENTNVSIAGAFKLQPFKAYGKISIEDLRLKELMIYKKELFNFDLDDKANLNLVLNYNIDTTKNLDLSLNSNKFEFNHVNLNHNKNPLINLEKLAIKGFDLNLLNQNIIINNIDLQSLKSHIILDKDGFNFSKAINQKQEAKVEKSTVIKKDSKPWDIKIFDFKLDNGDFVFNDKIKDIIFRSEKFSLNFNNLRILDSHINLDLFSFKNPNIIFNDNKNKLSLIVKNANINLNKLNLQNNILDINNINFFKENVDFLDKNSNINVYSKNINVDINGIKIDNGKTFINSSVFKMPILNFENKISKLKIETSNINFGFNLFFLDKEKISVKETKLKDPSIIIKDDINNFELNAKKFQFQINDFIKDKDNLSINFIKLLELKFDFLDNKNKIRIETENLNLEINKLFNTKNEFKIEKTNLSKPNISIVLAKNSLQKEEKEIKNGNIKNYENNSSSKKIENPQNKENQNTAKQNINIGPLSIIDGVFSFEDKNLPIPFKSKITKLNGKISEFKNIESSTTNLELKGVVDEYGIAKITGIIHPNNIKFLTDINMIFNNIAVKNFTPYSGKFIGREIKSGKLDLDLKYNIEKSNLDAKNSIIISQLELGEKVESSDAVSLPLDMAITLLKDSKGIIDIDIPISGNIDDPQFAVGPLIWKAFVNLMTKAVTAPFSLLSSMFNFNEDEIKIVKFSSLEDEVGPIQKETLDKIAQILKAKTEIAIELSASYNQEKESYELKKQNYLKKSKNNKNLKIEELEVLISKEVIKITDLEKIGKNRVSNINNYLIKEKGINPKQIILTNKLNDNNSSIELSIWSKLHTRAKCDKEI